MRYAIVSDIHSNVQAWKAVLLDIRSISVDRIISLGDLIGYGPNPAEVLELVHADVNHFILGNHDAALCEMMDVSCFNEAARDILFWTRDQVGDAAVRFLRRQALQIQGCGFRCVHGEFSQPGCFQYIMEPNDALPSWQIVDEDLLFMGHTHRPGIFTLGPDRQPRLDPPHDITLEAGIRYFINPGSVGQPRDGDARASYCIYDNEIGTVCFRRVPFDIDEYRKAIHRADITDRPSYFLRFDPRLKVEPLREMVGFHPPREVQRSMRNAVEMENLAQLKGRVRAWRFISFLLLLLSLLLGMVMGWSILRLHRYTNRAQDLYGYGAATPIGQHVVDRNLAPLPHEPVAAGKLIPKWVVHLGNRYKQSVSIIKPDQETSVLCMQSDMIEEECYLHTPLIYCSKDDVFSVEALVHKSDAFNGQIMLSASLVKRMGDRIETNHAFYVKTPNIPKPNGWILARKQTPKCPAGSEAIRFYVRGNFAGSINIKQLSIKKKPR